MMHIPHLVAALLAVRQNPLLPATYCTPECPSCKTEVSNFDSSISCLPNSTFIANCGTCQQCIITYAIEEGAATDTSMLEHDMNTILSFCENSTASDQIVALESQAAKLSAIGVMLSSASVLGQSKTASMVITAAPTATDIDVPGAQTDTDGDIDDTSPTTATSSSNSTRLSTIIPLATNITPSYPSVASATTTATPSPKPSSVWVAGPVAGSILGMATVFVVIFFTRRRQRRADMVALPPSTGKDFDTDSNRTSRQTNVTPDLRITVPPVEVANQEIHELPALEPVGTEMHTPRDTNVGGGKEEEEKWPLPLSPLSFLFAMSELRDQRRELEEGKKHETFYHA